MTSASNIARATARSICAFAGLFLATASVAQDLRPWMSPEVGDAWGLGYKGQGTSITVVDDFTSNKYLTGMLGTTTQSLRHGEWTRMQASMIAPLARSYTHSFTNSRAVALRSGPDILNLSYGTMAAPGYTSIGWTNREASIISYARSGQAVAVKAAGNDGIAIGQTNSSNQVDYLARDLIGAQSAIFVGALNANGTTLSPASLASYSNRAGDNATVQNQFLVVGVEGSKTRLYGTSFAAPIVSGYAAILSSKFTSATPTQVRNRLLDTARSDTISAYSRAIHGRGEASLANALAPARID